MSFRIRRKIIAQRFRRWLGDVGDAVGEYLNRKRYVGKYPKFKRFLLITFLVVVDAFVIVTLCELANIRSIFTTGTISLANEARAWDGGPGREESERASEVTGGKDHDLDTDLSVADMIRNVFPEDQKTALAVAKAESGLNPRTESTTDRMRDGRPFSVGLYQINLSVQKIDSLDCPKAFKGTDYGSVVTDEALYAACVAYAKDPVRNIAAARGIYERRGRSWTAWGAFANGSFKRFL